MKYVTLGKTDIKVSRICVGGMSFGKVIEGGHGWTLDRQETQNMLARAFELGVNFIDTANTYAGGTSEEYIGGALKALNIPRDKVVIATKVFFNLTTKEHLTKRAIMSEIDGSLKRLGTDYVDLYQIHRFDYDTPVDETMEALHELVKSGKVRALGASAMYGYQFHNMQIAAERNNWTPFSTMQNHYNLLYREDEHELIPVCEQYGVSLVPFSPLAGGHLSHKGWNIESKRANSDKVLSAKYDRAKDSDIHIIGRVAEVAEKRNVSMSEIALAWHYAKGVASPIVGATKASHFEQAVRAVDVELGAEEVSYLEELYTPHEIVGQIKRDGSMY